MQTTHFSNSLAANLTNEIRRMIVCGELPPGKPIRARELKDRFGVSHIPIREALRTLEGEGLVKYVSQRGAVPTDVSIGELVEIYRLRRLIECRAARDSAALYTDEQLSDLEVTLDVLEAEFAADRFSDAFTTVHQQFHWLLVQPASGVYTERLIRNLWQASRRYIHLSLNVRTWTHGQHHRDLLEAARLRDGMLLAQRLDEHLSMTEFSLTTTLALDETL